MILITGGSGYVGSHIVKKLAEHGRDVRVLVRDREHAVEEGRLQGLDVEWITGDVTDPETLAPALQGATAVIHTAAIAIEKNNATYEKVNFQGTVNMVEAAKAAQVTRFINLSQLGADPDLPYRFMASKGKSQAVHSRKRGPLYESIPCSTNAFPILCIINNRFLITMKHHSHSSCVHVPQVENPQEFIETNKYV